MGNCASNPKANESDAPVPEPLAEDVKVEETKPKETTDEKSLGTLLNEKGEKEAEEAKKEDPKTEEVAAEAEKKEEAKPEATEEAPKAEA